MIKEAFGTGEDITSAMQNARELLDAPFGTDIKFEILEQPKKKVLGIFGGSEAKVRAYYEADDPAPVKVTAAAPAAAPAPKPEKAEKPVRAEKTEKTAKTEKAEKAEKPAKKAPEEETPAVLADDEVSAYLTSVLTSMGVANIRIYTKEKDGSHIYDIESDSEPGYIIGKRGETLDALQFLCRLVSAKAGKRYDRISLNVGDFREKRDNTLRELAINTAKRVVKSGRFVALEPMNPYERRVIHTAVQEVPGATSYSLGTDSARRVIIGVEGAPKETFVPRERSGRQSPRRGSPSGRSGGGRSSSPRQAARPAVDPDRVPRQDMSGTSLYGKIK